MRGYDLAIAATRFYPMFHRYFDAGLAQASYLVACDRTREAVVIDPRRDVDVYLAAAQQHRLTISAAIETHVHADFVSGARELAAAGARTIAGPGAGLKFPSHEVHDNEHLALGDLALRFLHTPGHTPEHISIVTTHAGEPCRVFTGDTLFVGAVGRPDLLGEALMRRLAADLHQSLFEKLLALPHDVEIHPGHGAGSLCGAGIGVEPFSTIGWERRSNRILSFTSRDEFVAAVLADLPETPPYFARMKRVNQDGPALHGFATGFADLAALSARQASAAVDAGAVLLDLRNADAFCEAHPSGAMHIASGSKVGYWAGWVLPQDARIVLLADSPPEAAEAHRQLLRVGFEDIARLVEGGLVAWRDAGLPVSGISRISADDLRRRLERGEETTILDVRTTHEWEAGHVEGATHLPVGDVVSHAREFASRPMVATMCEGGTRSLLAASLLARAGLTNVVNVTGGMRAYRSLSR
jgi:hydroxyacylglutathione hydrolase